MKNTIKTLCFVLILGLALTIAGCSRKEPNEVQDIESVRANLREKVESGELTKEEAIVKLAEAEARLVSGDKDKDEDYPALNALSEKLKEEVDKGELTAEEAKDAWIKAAKEAKDKSGTR